MTLALALLATPAHAGAFRDADLPHTTTFEYEWTGLTGATGSTEFTFELGTVDDGTRLCRDTDACLSGTFTTGNGGSGTYVTSVTFDFANDCVSTSGQTFNPSGNQYRQDFTCDLYQSLSATYSTTGATYAGSVLGGSVDVTFRIRTSDDQILGVIGSPSYTGLSNDYAGTTVAFIGSTLYLGTFTEL